MEPDLEMNELLSLLRLRYSAKVLYAIMGGTGLGPLSGPKHQLWYMYKQQRCLDAVAEEELRRGPRYAWLVATRLDLKWLAVHPPLGLLDAQYTWMQTVVDIVWG